MAAITTRAGKGSPLTNNEVDANFTGLNSELAAAARAIAVQMTASATVGGIQQLDNDNLDMGTNDFTLEYDAIIPTTRPAADIVLDRKHDGTNGYILTLRTTGIVRLQINATTYDSTVALASATNVNPKLFVPVIRSSATTAGSVTFYTQGAILGTAVAISAGAPTSVNNASARIINGTTTTRTASSLQASRMYNRALTAAEVLDLSINGVALADRGATQTPVYTSGFSAGVDGWTSNGAVTLTGNIDGILSEDNWLRAVISATDIMRITKSGLTIGRRYRAVARIGNDTAGTIYIGAGSASVSSGQTVAYFISIPAGAVGAIDISEVAQTDSFTIRRVTAAGLYTAISGGLTFYTKDVEIKSIGLVSELLASNAQSNTGQIIDTSGNRNHALLPASGATVVGANPARSRQVRSRHQWTATSELQYLGGVNQEVLPPNAAIEFIDIESNASLSVNIGNGTTATQYASAVALVSGWNRIALASVFSGTTSATRKLTITPTASATAILNCIVTYHGTEVEM
jgi:hypothetical protein